LVGGDRQYKINYKFSSTGEVATEFVMPSLTALRFSHNHEIGYKYK